MLVSRLALALSTVILLVVDILRYRATAFADTDALASVIAENTAAAVRFENPDDARLTLSALRARPSIQRACIYLLDGGLFAAYEASPGLSCPSRQPASAPWRIAAGTAVVRSADRPIAAVYLERDLGEIIERVKTAGWTGLFTLFVTGAVALVLAARLHRRVSDPISQLASAARSLNPAALEIPFPPVTRTNDEIGDLVRAFEDMISRVREANARLVESNAVLRQQEAERERVLARERELSRLKDEFVAAVSHELRPPLSTILGWVQILSDPMLSEPARTKAIASIGRNARAQARVIEDLVDVSRIVTGKLNLRLEKVDVRDVVHRALEVVRQDAQEKSIALNVDVPAETCFVSGDRDRLQQITLNLLANAVKFTPHAGAVSVGLRAVADAVELTIRDTGVGIRAEFLPYVFDRFRQSDGTTTRSHGGLGLGLASGNILIQRSFLVRATWRR